MGSCNIEYIKQPYWEDQGFLCLGTDEPSRRSHNAIVHTHGKSFHIKVTFKGEFYSEFLGPLFISTKPEKTKLKRREQFEKFLSAIDFEQFQFLDDTVTELELTPAHPCPRDGAGGLSSTTIASAASNLTKHLRWKIHEDSSRVLYPLYTSNETVSEVLCSDIQVLETLAGGVSRVQIPHSNRETCYVSKEIKRPFYRPWDTDVILQELENLKLFSNIPEIVQLTGVLLSENPYQSVPREHGPVVLRGLLLEYHAGGTLEDAMTDKDGSARPWQNWALQIARGLNHLHTKGITHMDLKPSNIVIDGRDNAVLIDISGIGGVTFEWLAPELRGMDNPISVPFETRQRNDIWAYGRLLSIIVESISMGDESTRSIEYVAKACFSDCPALRMRLPDAITRLHTL
ncbi:serine/threonine protein kinase [Polytolypa hystricis UAMH7299]|uniref:Serine/threonine protein kinase n=1 Tax=Polytolypa hystricis (strain UAMH7299) TaxID=1447883 RepID=A0A2B7WEN1_POLH7|nr:serine/threonine protein kinase [Polytolypa hystricis UAMH7299]